MIDEWKDPLTRREAECLSLVPQLHTNDAIARRLDLSTNTVKNHVKAARDKLGGLGRYDAARRYEQLIGAVGGDGASTSPGPVIPEALDSPARSLRGLGSDLVSAPDGVERSRLREAPAPYVHDEADFERDRSSSANVETRRSSILSSISLILGAAVLVALLIVATPLMATSFEMLAAELVPLFR